MEEEAHHAAYGACGTARSQESNQLLDKLLLLLVRVVVVVVMEVVELLLRLNMRSCHHHAVFLSAALYIHYLQDPNKETNPPTKIR
jgi:hypothetical protein